MQILDSLQKYAEKNFVPIIKDEAKQFLIEFLQKHNFKNILEIGTAIGYSGLIILENAKNCFLTTIEKNEKSYAVAKNTFMQTKNECRVNSILGDAGEEIKKLTGKFDFIFLDGPKGQYLNYLTTLLNLLSDGGYILADNVYFHNLVKTTEKLPRKKRTMVVNLRKFINEITTNKNLQTTIYDIADGIAVIKKNKLID